MSIPGTAEAGKSRRTPPNPLYSGLVRKLASDLGVESRVGPLLGALSAGQWFTAVKHAKELSNSTYESSGEHFAMNQIAALIKKVPFEDPKLDPRATAIQKFWKSERRCKRLNQRIRAIVGRVNQGRQLRDHQWTFYRRLEAVRKQMHSLLGDAPPLSLLDECDFTGGAALGVHGKKTHIAAKLLHLSCTPAALPYFRAAVGRNAHLLEALKNLSAPRSAWSSDVIDDLVILETANKVDFVLKTAETHRCIAIEPTVLTFLQNGAGRVIAKRLRHWGVDIRDQSRNQHLAMLGSMLNSINPFVTIDLSSASDSICCALVEFCVPPKWLRFLRDIRCPEFALDGVKYRSEKFASMGNGFCFPLETAIFAAIVRSCYEETGDTAYAVYGDDIIVRQGAALLTIEWLNDVGFQTNVDKTFIHGAFRESCGADYFEGANVRPYTLDFIPVKYWDWFKVANGLRLRFGEGFSFLESWQHAVNCVPENRRYFRPIEGPDDSAITVEQDAFLASRFAKWWPDHWSWTWKERIATPELDPDSTGFTPAVQWYGALKGLTSVDYLPGFALRFAETARVRWEAIGWSIEAVPPLNTEPAAV